MLGFADMAAVEDTDTAVEFGGYNLYYIVLDMASHRSLVAELEADHKAACWSKE